MKYFLLLTVCAVIWTEFLLNTFALGSKENDEDNSEASFPEESLKEGIYSKETIQNNNSSGSSNHKVHAQSKSNLHSKEESNTNDSSYDKENAITHDQSKSNSSSKENENSKESIQSKENTNSKEVSNSGSNTQSDKEGSYSKESSNPGENTNSKEGSDSKLSSSSGQSTKSKEGYNSIESSFSGESTKSKEVSNSKESSNSGKSTRSKEGSNSKDSSKSQEGSYSKEKSNSKESSNSEDNSNSNESTRTKDGSNSQENLKSEENTGRKDGSYSKENSNSKESTESKEGSNSNEASKSKESRGSKNGSNSKENSNSKLSTGSKDGSNSKENSNSKESTESKDGSNSKENSNSKEITGSKGSSNSKENSNSKESTGSKDGSNSKKNSNSKESAGSKNGSNSKEASNSKESTKSKDGSNSRENSNSKESAGSKDASSPKANSISKESTESKNDSNSKENSNFKESTESNDGSNSKENANSKGSKDGSKESVGSKDVSNSKEAPKSKERIESKDGSNSKENSNSRESTESKNGSNSKEASNSKESTKSKDGSNSRENANSKESKDDSSSKEASNSKESAGSKNGSYSKENSNSKESAGSKDGSYSKEASKSKESIESKDGSNSKENSNSKESTRSKDGSNSKEASNSEESKESRNGSNSKENANSKESTGSKDGSKSKVNSNSKESTGSKDDSISKTASNSKESTKSKDGSNSKENANTKESTGSKDGSNSKENSNSKESTGSKDGSNQKENSNSKESTKRKDTSYSKENSNSRESLQSKEDSTSNEKSNSDVSKESKDQSALKDESNSVEKRKKDSSRDKSSQLKQGSTDKSKSRSRRASGSSESSSREASDDFADRSEKNKYKLEGDKEIKKKPLGRYQPVYNKNLIEDAIEDNLFFSSSPGHCKPICPCYMNGITYDSGDTWQKKDDPCTTYRCTNGFYRPVIQGTMYKGDCKNVGTTWTEGCFTYRIDLIRNKARYRLIEGGCEDEDGNCWSVGDQFRKNCNRYECQIVGTCYTISLLSKGCTFEGECKEVNNYWHDGCSIYQCMDYEGTAKYGKLHHEIMYWPEGNYGLLKPKSGCPVDIGEEWSEGHRGHFGNGHNYKSFDFDADGTYTERLFIHQFCVRQQVNDPTILPRYQTYWEPGKYCILRKNGTCPVDFKEGFITMDVMDGTEMLSTINGTLPDGIYNPDTVFYFCCRNDGKLDVPLVLPKERPFILFVDSSAEDCQEVRGMSHTLEYFAFDDTDANPKPLMNGSIPLTKDGDNNTEVYFCHYKPMNCGCNDGKGNIVVVGDRIQKGCAWYICKEVDGLRVLTVEKGGCMDDQGKCRNETEAWIESTGESCVYKRCVKSDTGTEVEFKVEEIYRGCKEEDSCRNIGYRTNRGCYSSVCTKHPDRPLYYFKMQKAGCSDGKGGCIPLGKEFTKGCMTYQCSAKTSKCGMKFIRGACTYDDGCYQVGEVWKHAGCHKLKCSMSRKGSSITFSIDSIEQECDYRGQCYKPGYRLKEGCYWKQCNIDPVKRLAYMGIVEGGCSWKGKCIGVNVTWNEGCTEYVCRWHQQNGQHMFIVDITNQKCSFNNECVNHGEIKKHDCNEYECIVTRKGQIQYGLMKPYRQACKDRNGNCIAIDEEIEEDCFRYKCNKGINYPEMSIVGGGCLVNGVCKDEDSVWTDERSCVDYRCVRENSNGKIYMKTTPVHVGCQHEGICRKHGEKWPTPNRKCMNTECSVSKGQDNRFQRMLKTVPSGCVVNGVCHEFNYTNQQGCIQYKCLWDEERQMASYRYVKGGCKEYTSSKCHDVGEEWSERYGKRMCLRLTCKKTGNMFHHDIGYMCQDADGNCVNPGQNFKMIANGERRECYCKQTGNHVTTVCNASSYG